MAVSTPAPTPDYSGLLRGLGGIILLAGGVFEFVRGGDPAIAGTLAAAGATTLGVAYYHP